MIRTVRIRGFKRFEEVEFRLPGHVVLAGPNNTGKTTVLQAIASWSLALRRWRELNNFRLRRGYERAPIARQAFSAGAEIRASFRTRCQPCIAFTTVRRARRIESTCASACPSRNPNCCAGWRR